MNLILIYLCNIIASAFLAISSFLPIVSTVSLALAFINVALIFLEMGYDFLAFSYVIVYVGAIIILFLFSIMLLNLKHARSVEKSSDIYYQFIFFFYILIFIFLNFNTTLANNFFITLPNEDLDLHNIFEDCFINNNLTAYKKTILYPFLELFNNTEFTLATILIEGLSDDLLIPFEFEELLENTESRSYFFDVFEFMNFLTNEEYFEYFGDDNISNDNFSLEMFNFITNEENLESFFMLLAFLSSFTETELAEVILVDSQHDNGLTLATILIEGLSDDLLIPFEFEELLENIESRSYFFDVFEFINFLNNEEYFEYFGDDNISNDNFSLEIFNFLTNEENLESFFMLLALLSSFTEIELAEVILVDSQHDNGLTLATILIEGLSDDLLIPFEFEELLENIESRSYFFDVFEFINFLTNEEYFEYFGDDNISNDNLSLEMFNFITNEENLESFFIILALLSSFTDIELSEVILIDSQHDNGLTLATILIEGLSDDLLIPFEFEELLENTESRSYFFDVFEFINFLTNEEYFEYFGDDNISNDNLSLEMFNFIINEENLESFFIILALLSSFTDIELSEVILIDSQHDNGLTLATILIEGLSDDLLIPFEFEELLENTESRSYFFDVFEFMNFLTNEEYFEYFGDDNISNDNFSLEMFNFLTTEENLESFFMLLAMLNSFTDNELAELIIINLNFDNIQTVDDFSILLNTFDDFLAEPVFDFINFDIKKKYINRSLESELETLGLVLYTQGCLYVVLVSILLLITLVGTVSLFFSGNKKEPTEIQNVTSQCSRNYQLFNSK